MPKRVKLAPIIQITPQGTFRVQFSRNGQKFDRTFKLRTEAQSFIDKFAADTLTLEAFVETSYKKSPEFRKLKPSSKTAYTSRLTKICSLIGHLPIVDLDKETVDRYLADRDAETTRLGRPPSRDTLRQELVVLGKVMRVAKGYGRAASNPVSEVEKPAQSRRVVRVSPEQRNNFLLLATGRIRYDHAYRGRLIEQDRPNERAEEAGRFLFVLSDLGGRADELASLPSHQVDFENSCVHLADTKKNEPQRRYFSVVGAKLLVQQLKSIENHPKNPDELLFPTRAGTPHDYQYSVEIVRNLGLVDSDFHSHACRREFVSNARELGYSDADIAKDLGVSIATLARYDVSTGQTAEERARRVAFNNKRTMQLRDAMSNQTAANKLAEAVALAEAHDGATEIAALDGQFALKVDQPPSVEEAMRKAVARGELGADKILEILLEAKARESKK